MDYCTINDLVDAITAKTLTQLTDDAGAGTYDSDVLTAEIANGQEEMDPYLRTRYSAKMPFVVIPGMLKAINVDIALYRVYKRRGKVPQLYVDAYDKVIKKLENIAKGLIDLGDSTAPLAEDNDSVTFTNKTPEDRKFRDPEGY